MATGDITATVHGSYALSSSNLTTVLNALNVGAATAGTETKTIHLIPTANGTQVTVVMLARSA